MPVLLALALAAALAAADQGPRPAAPRINVGGIVNAATNRPAPDNYISPGAIISIYGTGLANDTREVSQADLVNGFLPLTLSAVSVFFGQVQAPLFFVSPLQINAQAPAELLPGEFTVAVRLTSLESSEKVTVRDYSPGLFGVARHADGRLVTRELPARPGGWILVFGTGFGSPYCRPDGSCPLTRLMLTGQLAPLEPVWMLSPIEASIAGIRLIPEEIYYAGLAPSYAGLYQFNLRIPPATPPGQQEVRVQVAEEWSQAGVKIEVGR